MEAVLKERCEQLEAIYQADVDRLKGEHEKNMKNLEHEFQNTVCIVFVWLCLLLSTFPIRWFRKATLY